MAPEPALPTTLALGGLAFQENSPAVPAPSRKRSSRSAGGWPGERGREASPCSDRPHSGPRDATRPRGRMDRGRGEGGASVADWLPTTRRTLSARLQRGVHGPRRSDGGAGRAEEACHLLERSAERASCMRRHATSSSRRRRDPGQCCAKSAAVTPTRPVARGSPPGYRAEGEEVETLLAQLEENAESRGRIAAAMRQASPRMGSLRRPALTWRRAGATRHGNALLSGRWGEPHVAVRVSHREDRAYFR